jgi:hypothetical protein
MWRNFAGQVVSDVSKEPTSETTFTATQRDILVFITRRSVAPDLI